MGAELRRGSHGPLATLALARASLKTLGIERMFIERKPDRNPFS